MKGNRTSRAIQLLLKIGGLAVGLVFALIGTARELFASVDTERNDDRRLHDADLIGEYNHRTGRLDAGADAYGWYDED